jgi:valyl-tRNA synthetase
MVMMSLKFTGEVPFKEVYIHGLIRDAEGHKMSKSKGNVLDPIDLIDGIAADDLVKKRTYGLMQPEKAKQIEKNTRKEFPEGIASFGTDALRFTFCSMATFTREIRFDIARIAGNRNFCNKLWNASRYVMMNTEGKDTNIDGKKMALTLSDSWILSRLQKTIDEAHKALKDYRFDLYAQAIYNFTWNEFCDWYLELSKPTLLSTDSGEELLRGTRRTLAYTLETLLRLLHPIMPFITEVIWQRAAPLAGVTGKSIMSQPYPTVNKDLINDQAESELEWLKSVIISIRTIRSEMNISPAKQLPILLRKGSKADKANVEHLKPMMHTLAKVESITWIANNENPPPSASAFVGELEIFIPMAGFINLEEETARLKREIGKIEKDLTVVTNKLSNASFVDRAPADVVEKEKARQTELSASLAKLEDQLQQLNNL